MIEDSPFRLFKLGNCCVCQKQSNLTSVHLECDHQLHFKCLSNIILEKFGEYIDVAKLDKSNIIKSLKSNEVNTMTLGTENFDGIISCPECYIDYSILSPIYKKFGFPKKVYKVIKFFEEDQSVLTHNISTNIDIIHLLPLKAQEKLLRYFDYTKESTYITSKFMLKYSNINDIFSENNKDKINFHAVINTNFSEIKQLEYYPENECPVCVQNISSDSDTIDTDDCNIVYHCSIEQFINILNF